MTQMYLCLENLLAKLILIRVHKHKGKGKGDFGGLSSEGTSGLINKIV